MRAPRSTVNYDVDHVYQVLRKVNAAVVMLKTNSIGIDGQSVKPNHSVGDVADLLSHCVFSLKSYSTKFLENFLYFCFMLAAYIL